MDELNEKRRPPFAVAVSVAAVISIAVARLPETFVEQLRRQRPFDISTSGWVYRLMVVAAILQALYVGWVLLRVERVERERTKDPAEGRMRKSDVMRSLSRNAATIPLLTLVYGLSAFFLTGERGGYWLFAFVCAAQLLWYYRATGVVAGWLEFQPGP